MIRNKAFPTQIFQELLKELGRYDDAKHTTEHLESERHNALKCEGVLVEKPPIGKLRNTVPCRLGVCVKPTSPFVARRDDRPEGPLEAFALSQLITPRTR